MQKTAYEMRIIDWSSDVCSSDLDAGALAEPLDLLDRAVGVRPRLGMDGDRVRARLGEGFEIRIDRRDHQMDVEGLAGVGAQRLHHRRADRDVGDEMPVHHVDMDPVGARAVDRAYFLSEFREIGGEDRWSNTDVGHDVAL